jgi:hypothetical protein
VIVVEPVLRPVATPLMVIVAIFTVEEFHTDTLVMSCVVVVEPSRKVPVAVNCLSWPSVILEFAGVTTMDCNTPLVTVNAAVFEMLPEVAVIVELPWATAVASPCIEAALLMVATPGADELQVTVAVMSCVLLSLYVPVALKGCVVPGAMAFVPGVTAIDTRVAVTVKVAVPLTPPEVAVIVVDPVAFAVTNPVLEIVATEVLEEVQVAVLVRSLELPPAL